jgi:hypothetical protein
MKYAVIAFLFFTLPPSHPPEQVGPVTPKPAFEPAKVEPGGPQWEWYCDDPAEHPVSVVTLSSGGQRLGYDPDRCDSDAAKVMRELGFY